MLFHGPVWPFIVLYGSCTCMLALVRLYVFIWYIVQYDSECSHTNLFDLRSYNRYVLVSSILGISSILKQNVSEKEFQLFNYISNKCFRIP